MNVLDELRDRCIEARAGSEVHGAVRDALQRAVSQPTRLAEAVGDSGPGITLLHRADDLTILNVVWPPGISLFPHDHRMWAAIAIYGGQEDNTFFRRQGDDIVPSGGRELHERDVLLLGADAIHAVRNPGRRYTGAIHVYGGDFVAMERSQWDAETLQEQPYDLEAVNRLFAAAEDAYRASAEDSPVS